MAQITGLVYPDIPVAILKLIMKAFVHRLRNHNIQLRFRLDRPRMMADALSQSFSRKQLRFVPEVLEHHETEEFIHVQNH